MNKNHLYAFYGSLRRGMNNHDRYKNALSYRFTAWIRGYKLYSRGQYPCAIKFPNSMVLVEVFEITNPLIEKDIHNMEMEEGYYFENVTINEQEVGIYLFAKNENFQEVSDGDWVTFFRKRSR